jgi:predicted phage terminase large subunit-like protein
MTPLERATSLWDGEVRGQSREALVEKGHTFDDTTWAYRQAALQSFKTFMALIWKDRKGRRVKNFPVHDAMGVFLMECERRGIPAGVLAPMGLGKSEQGMAYCLWKITRDPRLRTGIVCDKDDHASKRVVHIRRYIETDKDYRRLFPEIKVAKTPRNWLVFRLTDNTTAKDESVEGAGVMSSGTGTRKEFIFFDDCVTAKNAITEPAQRPRVIGQYEQGWIGRITEDSEQPGWHYFIATLYHSADLWHRCMEKRDGAGRPVYAILKIGVADDFSCYDVEETWPDSTRKYTLPLCPGFWDAEAYQRKHDQLVFEGDASAWYTGYRNMVIDPEQAAFKKPDFFVPTQERPRSDYPLVVMYADPASSDAVEADNFAGWVCGWDAFRQAMVVLDGWYSRRDDLTKRVDQFLDMWEKWKPNVAAIEGQHEVSFGQRIEERAVEKGLTFRLRKMNHHRKKEERIAGMGPLFARRKILVDGNRFPWLWKEAALFPKAKHDDALDALEGAWDVIRRWLRLRGQTAVSFDPEAQYAVEGRSSLLDTQSPYRVPPLGPGDRPSSWGRIQDIVEGF